MQPHLVDESKVVLDHIAAYIDRDHGLWCVDRQQRLVEQGLRPVPRMLRLNGWSMCVGVVTDKFADQVQTCFLKAVQRDGWPPEGIMRQSQIFDRYVAPVLQDGGRCTSWPMHCAMRWAATWA